MIKAVLAGYYIGNDVQLEINTGKIINVKSHPDNKQSYILRNTMLRLLIFLLETKEKGGEVTDEEILLNVWDKYGLQSSVSRLWQVMQSLKYRLMLSGVPEDFIKRVKKGYRVKTENVKPYYFMTN
ncbi:transcriptional regulator [Kalamiella sp. sgz302252]|uniref:winged helix-turn-helix domain-containing protein n=1 Tax=Pantoea sp. sgz302252 TaxID=3341827 RepID=UPI0036D28BA4